jgi:hypothetical protein
LKLPDGFFLKIFENTKNKRRTLNQPSKIKFIRFQVVVLWSYPNEFVKILKWLKKQKQVCRLKGKKTKIFDRRQKASAERRIFVFS